MGKINTRGVLVGGLVAGVVFNIVDGICYGVLFKSDFPMPATPGPLGLPMMAWFIIMDFLYGFAAVYLYAAIRPRFGAGPKTALTAGLIMWVLVGLLHGLSEAPMGYAPARLYWLGTLIALVAIPLGLVVGAKFYTEPS